VKLIPRFLRRYFFNIKPFDRRRHERFPSAKEIDCICSYDNFGQKTEVALLVMNVSKGGLLACTDQIKIYPGKEVEIKFKPHDSGSSFCVKAKVVRTLRRRDQQIYYSGFKFLDSNQKDIQAFINSLI
jgi:hypothetical protein